MIKVTLNDIVRSMDVFNKIMQQPLKGSLAFKISRLAKALNNEMEIFNQERAKILQNYCEKDENGELKTDENGNVRIMPEHFQECTSEFNSLLATEVEVNASKIPAENIDDFTLTPQEMTELLVFFEED